MSIVKQVSEHFLRFGFHTGILFLGIVMIISGTLWSQNSVKWEFKTDGVIFGTPSIDGENIYVGSGDEKMYALHKETGKKVWEFKTNGEVHSSPLVADNLVIFGSRDGNLYAIEKDSGKEVWRFSSKGERKNGPWDYYLSSPRLDHTTVFWGSGDGHLYALDSETGMLIWKHESEGIIHADPVIHGNKVFIGSYDGNLYALNKLDGEIVWKFKTLGAEYFPKGEIQKAVLVENGTVYFGSRDYNIYALDENTGAVKWNMRETAGWIIATPIAVEDQIFFGTSDAHKFYSLNKHNGGLVWDMPLKMRVFGSAVSYKDYLYFGTFDGKIIKAEIKNGQKKWEFQTHGSRKNYGTVFNEKGEFIEGFNLYGKDMIETEQKILDLGAILSTPVIHQKTLYFGSSDGYLYALSL